MLRANQLAGFNGRRRTRSQSPSPSWGNVVSLLHFNGANGSTTITDEKGLATWTASSASITTSVHQLGGASLSISAGGYCRTVSGGSNFNIDASEKFTFAGFFKSTGTLQDKILVDFRQLLNVSGMIIATGGPGSARTNGSLRFLFSGADKLSGSVSIDDGQWHYIAVGRGDNGAFFGNVDGVVDSQSPGAQNDQGSQIVGTNCPAFMRNSFDDTTQSIAGYFDEWIFVVGECFADRGFVVPTSEYPTG